MPNLEFEFKDAFKITAPTQEDLTVWKDSLGSSYVGAKQAMRVVIEATHSAMVNRNIRWYIPSKMKDGTLTFINGNKPAKVLKHHDTASDPIGIVRGARFVETVPEDLIDNPDVQTLLSSTAEVKDQIKAMKKLIKSGVTSREDWIGLGYIELMADILDSDSIEKISDGRFDAVSTSFSSPGHAYCFICGQNWGQDGICDHFAIGETYEDDTEEEWPMMLVPGLHLYEEVSLVVKDADPITAIRISDGKEDGINKSVEYDDAWKDNLPASKSTFEFKDCEEDKMATKKKIKKPELSDKAKAVLAHVKALRPDVEEDKLNDLANKIADLQLEDGKFPHQEDAGIKDETAVKYALEGIENADKELKAEAINADIEKELDEDAKLEKEAIAKLSDSSFCGPDRTFLGHTEAYIAASKKVLDTCEAPVNKAEILAKLEKKAKAIGAELPKEDTVPVEDAVFTMPKSLEALKDLSDKEILILCSLADQEGATRSLKMKSDCSSCAEALTRTEDAEKKAEEALKDYATATETLAILREELKFQQADYVHQVDKYVDLEVKYRTSREEKLAIVGTLVGKYKSVDIAKESLKESDINTIETTIMDGFKIEEAAKKLNDGMEKTPKDGEALKDPTYNVDGDNAQIPEGLGSSGNAALDSIKDMISNNDINGALRLFNRMKSLEVFPKTLKFETISAADKDPAE